jgi:SP family general alpha glucoside:H+ symporter-like MFS transporter
MLKRLNGNVRGYDIELEYRVLNYEREQQRRFDTEASSASYAEIFRGPNFRRTVISWLPLQFQGLGGLSFVLSYTTYFFQLAGIKKPFQGNVIVKTIQLSAQIISFYNIEKFGRRPLLIIGGLGMTLGCLAIAIIGSVPHYTPPGGLVVAFFCLWTFSYSSSCAPIGYVYLAEISTPRLRAKTAGFAAACTALVGVVTNFCSPLLIASITYKT